MGSSALAEEVNRLAVNVHRLNGLLPHLSGIPEVGGLVNDIFLTGDPTVEAVHRIHERMGDPGPLRKQVVDWERLGQAIDDLNDLVDPMESLLTAANHSWSGDTASRYLVSVMVQREQIDDMAEAARAMGRCMDEHANQIEAYREAFEAVIVSLAMTTLAVIGLVITLVGTGGAVTIVLTVLGGILGLESLLSAVLSGYEAVKDVEEAEQQILTAVRNSYERVFDTLPESWPPVAADLSPET